MNERTVKTQGRQKRERTMNWFNFLPVPSMSYADWPTAGQVEGQRDKELNRQTNEKTNTQTDKKTNWGSKRPQRRKVASKNSRKAEGDSNSGIQKRMCFDYGQIKEEYKRQRQNTVFSVFSAPGALKIEKWHYHFNHVTCAPLWHQREVISIFFLTMNSEKIFVLCLIMKDKGEIKRNMLQTYKKKSPKMIMTVISISSSGLKKEGANYREGARYRKYGMRQKGDKKRPGKRWKQLDDK